MTVVEREFAGAHPEGSTIEATVRPKAGASRVIWASGRLRIEVKKAPEGGAATLEAVEVLAKKLGVPTSSVKVLRGERSRHKVFLVKGLTPAEVMSRLGEQ